MKMANITLTNIQKVYAGDVTAVHHFSLEIEDREFIVLVGPSGCGKSTTLRMIAGLEEITAGELFIGGRKVNDIPPKDRDIAMVFQNYALYPHMTVYKNMAFSLKLRGFARDEIDSRVFDAARILGIEHLLDRKPKALSGGERQRVALGRAMVRNPAVFLLDEPLSNLDAKLRASMRTELIKLHRRLETTFIYVTHDQTEAMTMGDRIVIMKDGFIQQTDTPQNLYDRPCNTFVAGFIGSPQMNFMTGILENNESECHVLVNGDKIPVGAGMECGNAEDFSGKSVTVGIRPEDIYADGPLSGDETKYVISATVEVSEPMGSEIFLYLNYQDTRLTARVPPRAVYRPGDRINVGLDITRLHLFDPQTGRAIMNIRR